MGRSRMNSDASSSAWLTASRVWSITCCASSMPISPSAEATGLLLWLTFASVAMSPSGTCEPGCSLRGARGPRPYRRKLATGPWVGHPGVGARPAVGPSGLVPTGRAQDAQRGPEQLAGEGDPDPGRRGEQRRRLLGAVHRLLERPRHPGQPLLGLEAQRLQQPGHVVSRVLEQPQPAAEQALGHLVLPGLLALAAVLPGRLGGRPQPRLLFEFALHLAHGRVLLLLLPLPRPLLLAPFGLRPLRRRLADDVVMLHRLRGDHVIAPAPAPLPFRH